MKLGPIRKFILPPGPILSLTLIGLLLLSATLYYRAVKIQRFLEPALALSQPRNEFAEYIDSLLKKELETAGIKGVRFILGSVLVDGPLLFDDAGWMKESASVALKKLGRVFLTALKEDHARSHFDLIIIRAGYPVGFDTEANKKMRLQMQDRMDLVLDSLFKEEPELEREYATYFAATTIPINPSEKSGDLVEFKIIPSEQIHIDVLLKLRKYVHE